MNANYNPRCQLDYGMPSINTVYCAEDSVGHFELLIWIKVQVKRE